MRRSTEPTKGDTLSPRDDAQHADIDALAGVSARRSCETSRGGQLEAVVESLEQTVLEKQADAIKRGMSRKQAEKAFEPMWMISDEDG